LFLFLFFYFDKQVNTIDLFNKWVVLGLRNIDLFNKYVGSVLSRIVGFSWVDTTQCWPV